MFYVSYLVAIKQVGISSTKPKYFRFRHNNTIWYDCSLKISDLEKFSSDRRIEICISLALVGAKKFTWVARWRYQNKNSRRIFLFHIWIFFSETPVCPWLWDVCDAAPWSQDLVGQSSCPQGCWVVLSCCWFGLKHLQFTFNYKFSFKKHFLTIKQIKLVKVKITELFFLKCFYLMFICWNVDV